MSHHYVKFDHVSYTYPGGYEALKDVSLYISHGEKVAIVGANGAGKSTLMLHVNGLLQPTSGSVTIGDIPITKSTLPIIRQAVGLVFQNPDDQLFMPTVGATSLRKRASYQLSGGQKRSVAIATVLSMEPDILVLDEPSSNLDPHSRRLMMEQLRRFKHTCIVTTHDIDMVKELCARTIVMAEGRIIADGATEDVFRDEEVLCQGGLV